MESEYHIHIGKTGESDVLVSFIDEYGDNTELIWIWDPVERYVFREDLSTIAIGDSDQDAEQDMHLEAAIPGKVMATAGVTAIGRLRKGRTISMMASAICTLTQSAISRKAQFQVLRMERSLCPANCTMPILACG